MYNILYVDDESGLLEICKIFLEQSGEFAVTTMQQASEAIASPDILKFDAIISDYQMPEVDGITFLKTIRERSNDIPFILFTGRGREEVVIEAINSGADFYLQKGGDPKAQFAELAHKIRIAIQSRKATEALKDSEQRLSDIINFLPDATFAIDKTGQVISWNRAIEEMTGIPAAKMLGKGNYEYAIPFYGVRRKILIDLIFESRETIAKTYEHIIQKKDILVADTSLPRLMGKQYYLMGTASPLYNRHGEVVGAIESIRDITERKQDELELQAAYEQITASEEELRSQYDELAKSESRIRESEKRFRELSDLLPQGIYEADTTGRVTYANRIALEMSGYRDEEILTGVNVLDVIAPDHRPRAASVFRNMVETGVLREGSQGNDEYDLLRRDGSVIPVLAYSSPITRDGRIVGVRGIFIDISERKRAEAALRENEEKFRTLFDNVSDAVYIHEILPDQMPGKFLEVNSVMCNRLGYTREELLTMSVTDIISETQRQKIPEIREKMDHTGFLIFFGEHKRKDGSVFPVEINSHRFTFSGKEIVLASARDITGQSRVRGQVK